MDMEITVANEVRRVAAERLRRGLGRITTSLNLLREDDVWRDFNSHLVSIGNHILHLIGNLSQHIISGLGGEQYTRERDREFTDKPGSSRADLLEELAATVEKVIAVIQNLTGEQLAGGYVIQGFDYTGVEDVMAIVEHFSYHVGQITFAVKYLKDVDVGYSQGIDLDRQNTP